MPQLEERIDTFKQLVDKLGNGAVLWQFDPLILTHEIDIDKLLRKIEYIGNQLQGYTEKHALDKARDKGNFLIMKYVMAWRFLIGDADRELVHWLSLKI